MLPVALAVLAWTPALVGLGAWAPQDGGPLRRLGLSGLVGLATLSAAAIAVHLAVPISPLVALAGLAAGWLAFASTARRHLAGIRRADVAIAAAAVVLLAAATQLPARHYDAGLYQLQSVAWARGWPQVQGLASLHGRLGFNSAWFPLAAMLEAPGLAGRSVFFLGAFPVLFTLLVAIDALRRLGSGRPEASAWYLALALFPALLAIEALGSLDTDPPTVMLGFLSLGSMLGAYERPESFAERAVTGFALACLAFTIKVSAVMLVAGWLVILVTCRDRLSSRSRAVLLAMAAASLVPWGVHGVIASGCILYPAPASCWTSLPWSTPVEDVAAMNDVIRAWARAPGDLARDSLRGWGWVAPWIRNELTQRPIAIVLLGAAAGALWQRSRLLAPHPARAPLAVAAAGALFWFLSAPSPRFGLAYLLPLAALPLAVGAAERGPALPSVARRLSLAAATLAALAYVHWSLRPLRRVRPATAAIAHFPTLPSAELRRRVTPDGTAVTTPASGDQCWDAAPPCTPWLDPALRWEGARIVLRRGPP